ncbi:WcaF family extracellular polysaccharide biosynthesis acetyltransferase [Mucilaginibacter myungsuensis]|uniref:Colanic acid biosynthesis acetyltransferase WcaF n=1 Tax=Mucilaginibacter myungsuensis TaxID=649104 RepID=A0A929PV76_9SPHI|nr:WcaF family extracellular polysaccharide biosynthesis acetyltransferase [Mucilaginibacter myungsuensis]MBE9660844.1 colanic acid biosynthesis acetyltransferase WcaF [Mucilaginibacter myungsuensis]MDN3600891.1 WcaF family extracellular polysaccharide biosynthesis acetyltransferase [Mucilaginibacter myungsuensis]
MQKTDLSNYNNSHYYTGANALKRATWYIANACIFKSSLVPSAGLKRALLRSFGASIGKGVVIKPCVNVKYPWNLAVGENTWIGENVWIDSLVNVTIGANVCLSQGAVLITGSHNYKLKTFDLILGEVTLEDGVWIGAGAMVNQGVTAHSHSVLTAGSIATKDMDAYTIYQGNPAMAIRKRSIE